VSRPGVGIAEAKSRCQSVRQARERKKRLELGDLWDRSGNQSHYRSRRRSHQGWSGEARDDRRMRSRRSARGQMRGVRSDSICVVTSRGADGPARRSRSVSQAFWARPPPIHLPRTAAGHDRMARSSRRSPVLGAAGGSWTRAWGQREPAVQGTGRLNPQPGRIAELAQGWAGHPGHGRQRLLTSRGIPAPDGDAPH
jgi:hypothetical protein